MRHGRGLAALVLLVCCATIGTCVYPTEQDASVHVSVTPIHVLLRGSEAFASATAWQIVGPTDSQPIPNVKFVWVSSNALIASVNNEGRIVGVKSGTVVITAAAANFDKNAKPGRDTVRVSAALEIDSVRPKIVKYGERLRVYGVGVDSILQATLAGATLFRVPFADIDYANGTAQAQYWVPPPATTDSLFFLGIFNGSGVFGFVHESTQVVEHDLYDPNEINPARLSIGGPGPFPNTPLSFLLYYNPALSFEVLPRGVPAAADWFRFGQTSANAGRDLTFIVESPQLAGTFSTFLSDSLGWDGTTKKYFLGRGAWTFGPGSHACHGLAFDPPEATADSTIVAFKGLALPLDSLDAIAVYTQPGRYGLVVINGYSSELPADKHEDDNSCNAADLRGVDTVGKFRDTLAIENPHDIDWLKFNVPGTVATSVQFQVHAFPGPSTPAVDSLKALDLYVIKVPSASDTVLSVVLADTAVAARTEHNVTVLLAPGDYYAVVLDFAGVVTTYEICAAPALGACATGFPAPPATLAGSVQPRFTRPPPVARRGHRARAPAGFHGLVPSRP
ncbi:MAG TPA: Ig-like domain-containing protein [Gemmatimonadales bacterium]|nr:Ig-like domain-containing protein [Gemmatimonadales bacterium]